MTGTTGIKEELRRFRSRLNAKELQEFSDTSLHELQTTINSIQRSQEDKKSMMNLTRIQRFLEGMDQLGKVIDVFLNTSEVLAFVWGPMKCLLLTASTWTESFDTLLGAYERIGQHLPLLSGYSTLLKDYARLLPGNRDYIQDVLGWIYKDIMDFHSAALQFFSRPVWRQVFKSMWKDFDTTFKGTLNNLKQHNELLDRLANTLHMAQSQEDSQALRSVADTAGEMRDNIQKYKLDMDQRWEAAKERERDRKRERKFEVLQWVSAASMSELHENFLQITQSCPGSGEWILGRKELKDWKDSDTPNNSVLWMHGIPGAGKTILASKIADSCEANADFKTCYFYCREGDNTTTTCKAILKGLIAQMINHCEDLIGFCHDKMNTTPDLTLTAEDMAKQLLEIFCRSIPKQFIIIDGLDECAQAQRGNVLKIINGIVKSCDETPNFGNPRVLFISRKLGDIERSLAEANPLEIRRNDNFGDIEVFVRDKLKQLKLKLELDQEPQLTDEVQELTLLHANGMFLFAYLVTVNLDDCRDLDAFREEASKSTFPKGLEDAYNRILNRMHINQSNKNWESTCRLLGWIVSAKRPLKMHELQAVLSIEPTKKYMDYRNKKLRVHITDCCGSLVQMVGNNRVELIHHTAREFIVKNKKVDVNQYTIHYEIAILCLQYLTFDCFGKDVEEDELLQYIDEGFLSLQDYAVSKWFHHLQTLIQKCGSYLSGKGDNEEQQRRGNEAEGHLFEALDDFMDFYQEGLHIKDADSEKWKRTAAEDCEACQGLPLFEHLRDIWAHVRMHQQTPVVRERDFIGIPELLAAVKRNRKAMEGIAAKQKFSSQLEAYYGQNLFKCTRLTCLYFYEGFKTSKDRDKHLKRHDRPIQCVIETCDQGTFGFTSNTQLEKHMRRYHPEAYDTSASEFQFAALNQRKIEETKFTCPICKKHFTRNINLKAHLDSHNGLKPFACPECGRAFTRKNDMTRHQKIHSRAHSRA